MVTTSGHLAQQCGRQRRRALFKVKAARGAQQAHEGRRLVPEPHAHLVCGLPHVALHARQRPVPTQPRARRLLPDPPPPDHARRLTLRDACCLDRACPPTAGPTAPPSKQTHFGASQELRRPPLLAGASPVQTCCNNGRSRTDRRAVESQYCCRVNADFLTM